MRLKTRVEELETYTNNLSKKIDFVREHTAENCENFDKLQRKFEKQEETIKEIIDLCKPLIAEKMAKRLNELTNAIEKDLKDLFSSEPAPKSKKSAKSSAEKCKKCGESAKATKKTSKKENK